MAGAKNRTTIPCCIVWCLRLSIFSHLSWQSVACSALFGRCAAECSRLQTTTDGSDQRNSPAACCGAGSAVCDEDSAEDNHISFSRPVRPHYPTRRRLLRPTVPTIDPTLPRSSSLEVVIIAAFCVCCQTSPSRFLAYSRLRFCRSYEFLARTTFLEPHWRVWNVKAA